MIKLTSKLQYKNYEKGEYSNASKRTFEQTLNLINDFPWEVQRINASVELTGPSVCIENDDQVFLKIGHYFSSKFILYLFINNKVYEKILLKLSDFEYYLKLFFDNDLVKILNDSVKKPFIFFPSQFFLTKQFTYSVNLKSITNYILFPQIYPYVLLIFASTGFLTIWIWEILFYMSIYWFILHSVGIYLLFNYIKYGSHLEMIISKGQHEFSFGEKGNLKNYNKKNISKINKYRHLGSKNLWNDCIIFEIHFLDGEVISFPNLILTNSTFDFKFNDMEFNEIHKFLAKYNADY